MNFVDISWQSYNILRRDPDKKKAQINALFGTGLYEGENGAEFCFVPTKKIFNSEKSIQKMYDQVKVGDHEISLCNEVYFTSKIEGANTTLKRTQEIHDGKPINHDNYFSEMMVLGGFNATKFLNVHGNKLNEQILIKMWNLLTDGARDNSDIKGDKYRIGNVGVGNHMGLNWEFVEDAMNHWFSFYHADILEDHPFVKAALLHFSFEYIHPFCDGNGRCGRLLMTNYLIDRGYDKLKAISFSKSIAKDYNGYYSAFTQSENVYTDCTPFLEYMMDIYEDALYDVLELEQSNDKKLEDDEQER